MPIMKPEHQRAMLNAQKILAEVGVEGSRKPTAAEEESPDSLKAILARKGLSLEEVVEELAIKVRSGNEGIANRALETALKMHGALKEAAQGPAAPSFTIVINDSKATASNPSADLNLPEGVNPIFVPRQLLDKLSNSTDSQTTTN